MRNLWEGRKIQIQQRLLYGLAVFGETLTLRAITLGSELDRKLENNRNDVSMLQARTLQFSEQFSGGFCRIGQQLKVSYPGFHQKYHKLQCF
jgi:hypothetical protein